MHNSDSYTITINHPRGSAKREAALTELTRLADEEGITLQIEYQVDKVICRAFHADEGKLITLKCRLSEDFYG